MPPVCAHRALLRVRLLCMFGMLKHTFIDSGNWADMRWPICTG